jgi:Mrp family chromosome partitioning ATPase
VDGVVLVVEADKTRWPVAQSVKERIIQHGGNVLGMVLNKRRYYIPGFIYNRL